MKEPWLETLLLKHRRKGQGFIVSEQQLLEQFEKRLLEAVSQGNSTIRQMMVHPVLSGGKYIRPRLVLMSAQLFAPVDNRILDTAVAVECVHTASLIHDDIIDGAPVRRGRSSTSGLYGPQYAVLVGDSFYATAFQLITRHHLSSVLDLICQSVTDMCLAEISQDLSVFNVGLSEEEYMRHIYGKTASLFGASCAAGALAAGARDEEAHILGEFGRHLGFAYQIADDILDYTGDPGKIGKPAGGDFLNGIMTLPLIRALAVSPRRQWLSSLVASRLPDPDHLPLVLEAMVECGALEYSRAWVLESLTRAAQCLSAFGEAARAKELAQFAASLVDISRLTGGLIPPQQVEVGLFVKR